MNGIIVEYLLGLYFAISALSFSYPDRSFVGDWVRFILGIVLIIFAIFGINPIR